MIDTGKVSKEGHTIIDFGGIIEGSSGDQDFTMIRSASLSTGDLHLITLSKTRDQTILRVFLVVGL